MPLPTDRQSRKDTPVTTGCIDYFPDALAAVAHLSFVANKFHNPGEPMHWDREKSADQADCIARHLIERGTVDTDGIRHSAKMAWRALALLQLELEAGHKPVDPPGYEIKAYPDSREAAEARIDLYEHDQGSYDPRCRMQDELVVLGCPVGIATVIVKGTTFTTPYAANPRWVYVAGPMRGRLHFNFPAFDKARDRLLAKGYNVISPADIDRASGFKQPDPGEILDPKPFVLRDFWALYFIAHKNGGSIYMLCNWQGSIGASAERALANWLGLSSIYEQGS